MRNCQGCEEGQGGQDGWGGQGDQGGQSGPSACSKSVLYCSIFLNSKVAAKKYFKSAVVRVYPAGVSL